MYLKVLLKKLFFKFPKYYVLFLFSKPAPGLTMKAGEILTALEELNQTQHLVMRNA